MDTQPRRGSKQPVKRRRKVDPVRGWASRLNRYRPNLMPDTLVALRSMYGTPVWQRVYDPTSELILTILSANSADINAEKAFDALCRHWPPQQGAAPAVAGGGPVYRAGWGGVGIEEASANWATVADAPLDELIDVIRPGGLAPTKAPRIQAVLRKIASVVLMFAFGMPLMPVDRHVERVTKRIGLIPPKATAEQAHDYLQALLPDELVHEAHVNFITHGRQTCHALRPEHDRCAIA